MSVIMAVITVLISAGLLVYVNDTTPLVYAIGDWSAPFGIVLVADRLADIVSAFNQFIGGCCCTL